MNRTLARLACKLLDHSWNGEVPLGMTVFRCRRCRETFLVRRGWKPRVLR